MNLRYIGDFLLTLKLKKHMPILPFLSVIQNFKYRDKNLVMCKISNGTKNGNCFEIL
jgi:hypothetical protein